MLIMAERCDQCLFSPNAIVSPERRADIIAKCKRDGSYFICHKASIAGRQVYCRGFYDAFPLSSAMSRLAKFLKLERFVEEKDLTTHKENLHER